MVEQIWSINVLSFVREKIKEASYDIQTFFYKVFMLFFFFEIVFHQLKNRIKSTSTDFKCYGNF